MRVIRRRRVYSILGFLGIVAFIFICFQLFTHEVLNSETSREARNARMEHNHPHEALLPPTKKAELLVDRKNRLPPPTSPKMKIEGLRPDINAHVVDEECLPGSDCAKKRKIQNAHVGESRLNKYGVDRPVTKKNEADSQVKAETLQDSNKRLMDRIEKFGQYVDQKIKENENFEKVFREKLEKVKSKNATKVSLLKSGMAGKNVEKILKRPGFVVGVQEKDQHLYTPDRANMFTCVNSKEQIPWEQVNDDYCDCEDGTDEPGTAACPAFWFYCTFQLEGSKALWVWSTQVNDGICDCCDGSDESFGMKLPEHVKRKGDGPYAKIFQEPCKDRCADLITSNMKRVQEREQGLRIRQTFALEVQKNYKNIDTKLYGEDGAWNYLLSKCFDLKVAKYQYKFCPFRSVSQHDPPAKAVNIGRNPVWQSFDYSTGYRLLMDGGEMHGCPDKRLRKTLVEFSCGLENKLLGVHESESCSYSIQFETPLACL